MENNTGLMNIAALATMTLAFSSLLSSSQGFHPHCEKVQGASAIVLEAPEILQTSVLKLRTIQMVKSIHFSQISTAG